MMTKEQREQAEEWARKLAQCAYPDTRPAAPLLRAGIAASERLEDFEADFRAILNEECAGDEKHCSCVPHLRERIAGLRAMIEHGNAVPILRYNMDAQWIYEQRERRAWLAAWDAEWRAQDWKREWEEVMKGVVYKR